MTSFTEMVLVELEELQQRFDSYLSLVRAGETVLILDRRVAVARLVPPERKRPRIRAPTLPFDLRNLSRVEPLEEIDVVESLRRDRDER